MPIALIPVEPKQFNSKAFLTNVTSTLKTVEAGMLRDYQSGTRTWQHKVKFNSRTTINPNGSVSVEVDTDDLIYLFVHEGTKPHIIRAKRAKYLKFQSGFTPKTIVGNIQAGAGAKFGDFVFRQQVRHPGTKPRNFGKLINNKWRPFFERDVRRAIAAGAKDSGHEI